MLQFSWFAAWVCVAIASGVSLALVGTHLIESHRFVRSRLERRQPTTTRGRVAVIAPCKGLDLDLEANLRALFEQDHPDYHLAFVVQHADDPACAVIRRLLAEYSPARGQLIVTGAACDTGQKVHNLRLATAKLPNEIKYLAFVDSDARPGRDWLRRLVERLDKPRAGAATGYRWFVPQRSSPANHFLYSINAAVAAGLGPGGHHLIWGGSWAIRRELFDDLQMREAWRGTLSDDLVATRVLKRAGLKIEFEPTAMLASSVDHDWRQTAAFVRRQYLIARFYAQRYWLLVFAGTALGVATFWGGLGLLIAGWVEGAAWTWLPAMVCPLYYAATVLRGILRRKLAQAYCPEHAAALRPAVRFDIWAAPLVALANLLGLVSSLVGSRLEWRGITYRLARGGQVQIERRDDGPLAEPIERGARSAERGAIERRDDGPLAEPPRRWPAEGAVGDAKKPGLVGQVFAFRLRMADRGSPRRRDAILTAADDTARPVAATNP